MRVGVHLYVHSKKFFFKNIIFFRYYLIPYVNYILFKKRELGFIYTYFFYHARELGYIYTYFLYNIESWGTFLRTFLGGLQDIRGFVMLVTDII